MQEIKIQLPDDLVISIEQTELSLEQFIIEAIKEKLNKDEVCDEDQDHVASCPLAKAVQSKTLDVNSGEWTKF
jgi:hypothetical protein